MISVHGVAHVPLEHALAIAKKMGVVPREGYPLPVAEEVA